MERIQAIQDHLEPSECAADDKVGKFRHGGELVAAVLKKHGVKFLFTLIGGHISPVIIASKAQGIRVIDVRHEVNAVFAADAVSRLSPVPGVACVTAGPGLTNTITAVKNANLAQSPLILLGGATSTLLKGRGSLQDIDQQSLFAPHVKWQAAIKTVRDIIPSLERAFYEARSGVPGPVFIELPIDILYPEKFTRMQVDEQIKGGSLTENVMKWYVTRHVNNIFAGKEAIPTPKILPPTLPLASDSQVNQTLAAIQASKKPVFILGSQTILQNEKVSNVVDAVTRIGVPVYLSGMARGLMGKTHPLQLRHKRAIALKESDLIILVGVPFDFRLNYGQGLRSKIISINLDKTDLYKNRTPDLPIFAEPSDFLIRLAKKIGESKSNLNYSSWLAALRKRDQQRDEEVIKLAEDPTDKFLNPLKVLLGVEKALSDNTILVADGGDFVATASYILRPPKPLSWLDPGVFGTLGVGAGFALGAKLCRPESEIWLIWGDGSAGYSLMEYDTFVRHNVPIISIIGNDACWSQIYREQVETFKDDAGCMLVRNDYHKIADALGGRGFVIGGEGDQHMDEVFQEAKKTSQWTQWTACFDQRIDRENRFQKGFHFNLKIIIKNKRKKKKDEKIWKRRLKNE